MTQIYFQKGFGLKAEVGPLLARSYQSPVVETLKSLGYVARASDLHLKLAREFGFCYGVDRAVEYAYETRHRFPDRDIYLSAEIIHNPDATARLTERSARPCRPGSWRRRAAPDHIPRCTRWPPDRSDGGRHPRHVHPGANIVNHDWRGSAARLGGEFQVA